MPSHQNAAHASSKRKGAAPGSMGSLKRCPGRIAPIVGRCRGVAGERLGELLHGQAFMILLFLLFFSFASTHQTLPFFGRADTDAGRRVWLRAGRVADLVSWCRAICHSFYVFPLISSLLSISTSLRSIALCIIGDKGGTSLMVAWGAVLVGAPLSQMPKHRARYVIM